MGEDVEQVSSLLRWGGRSHYAIFSGKACKTRYKLAMMRDVALFKGVIFMTS